MFWDDLLGYDPFRLYYDVPVWGGWRELRDPLTQRSTLVIDSPIHKIYKVEPEMEW